MTKGSQAVVGITTGTTTIIEAPEGTQMPFIVGDFVTLDTANDSNYTSKINHVKITDVNNNMPYGASGFAKSRITVAADTSGIITAYNSNSGGSVMTSHKLSAIIADGETANSAACLYFQQVQRTG